MKKIILLAAITVFGVATSNAQTAKKAAKKADAPVKVETQKVDGPGIVFENETIDYGTIPHNSDGNREFVFVNNGNKPLKIESTQGSCGCTVPTKPEGDIAPGAKGKIGVKYKGSRAYVLNGSGKLVAVGAGSHIFFLTSVAVIRLYNAELTRFGRLRTYVVFPSQDICAK